MMKKCPKCQELKEDDCFYVQKSAKKYGQLSSWCKECCSKQSGKRYKENPEKCKNEHREWVSRNKEKVAFTKAKSSYGITKEQYDSLKRVCVICGSTDNLKIDHSHQSGRIRGMLCDHCNKGLGFFKDDPTLLLRASDYIMGVAKPDIFEKTYELFKQEEQQKKTDDFKSRLIEEQKQLEEKLKKDVFNQSESRQTLDAKQQELLFVQAGAMYAYNEVLKVRIAQLG